MLAAGLGTNCNGLLCRVCVQQKSRCSKHVDESKREPAIPVGVPRKQDQRDITTVYAQISDVTTDLGHEAMT